MRHEYRKPVPEWMPPSIAGRMQELGIPSVTALERKADISKGRLKRIYIENEGLGLPDTLRLLAALDFSLDSREFQILKEIPVAKLLK